MKAPPPIRYAEMALAVPAEGPIDLRTLVPGEGPIEIEIGFGRGRFLLERARAAPDSRVIGIEIKSKLAHWVEQRRAREGLTNAIALWGDAREALTRAIPDACVTRAFVHFPDPWWKKRHTKRRVVDESFLDHVARLLVPGGELFVQTDVADRAEQMRDAIVAQGSFTLLARDDNPYGARSNREARADEDGLPVYRLHARR